jgi:hypothetical protein
LPICGDLSLNERIATETPKPSAKKVGDVTQLIGVMPVEWFSCGD